jgi:hypothetical protein
MYSYEAVYVFDLDGAITDPRDSSVDEVVVNRIGHMLETGAHIAVNTGRSFVWVQQNLVTRLQSKVSPQIFDKLYVRRVMRVGCGSKECLSRSRAGLRYPGQPPK